MKRICVLLLISLPLSVQAQLEAYGRYTANGSVEPIINYFASKLITEKISGTFFSLVQQKWSEALIGVKYAPSNSLNLSASAGIEHGTKNLRLSASIWSEKGKISFLLLGELGTGKDNYLYKSNVFYKYTDQFTFGVTAWRFHGIGPNMQLTISKFSSTIWLMPAYDFEVNKIRVMVGIRATM